MIRYKPGTLLQTGVRATALAICAAILHSGYGQQQGSGPVHLQPIQQVSLLSNNNQNPSIAYNKDGQALAVAWDGIVNGKRRILLRERVNGHWLPAVIVDDSPAGKNESPTVQIDQLGMIHIAWVQQRSGRKAPVYARRLSRSTNKWHYQTIPFPAESSTQGNCDLVQLKLKDDSTPWLVWQFGYGSVYSIACSHYNDSGLFETDEITPGSIGHNVEPKIFFTPEPTVYWYVSQSDQFYLVGATYNSAAQDWQITPPENLDALPGDNLPELFQTNADNLAAIWYEQANPDDQIQTTDHVLLGIQNPETKGRGEVIDQQVGSDYHSVTGTHSNSNIVASWVSESYTNGSQIYLGVGPSADQISTVQLSPNTTIQNINPVVTSSHGQSVTVAWEQDSITGDSQIVLRDINLR